MKNLWIQTDNAFATWRADVTAVQRRPQAVLGLVQAVLAAGANWNEGELRVETSAGDRCRTLRMFIAHV